MPSACATRYSIQHLPGSTVLWMDIAENYQRRSGPEVVLAAIEEHLG